MKALAVALVRSKEWQTITFIRYFSFLLQQVDIRVEEVELLRLLNFAQLFLALLSQRTESDEEAKLLASFQADKFTRKDYDLAARYYFELLALNPIKSNISFQNMPTLHEDGTVLPFLMMCKVNKEPAHSLYTHSGGGCESAATAGAVQWRGLSGQHRDGSCEPQRAHHEAPVRHFA